MATVNDGSYKTFVAGATVSEGGALKLSSGNVIHCTASDDDMIGTADHAASSGDSVRVKLRQGVGTHKMLASAAISAGAMVALTTAGKIVTQATTVRRIGTALEAATADGSIIECLLGGYKVTTAS